MRKKELILLAVLFTASGLIVTGWFAQRPRTVVMAASEVSISGVVKDDAGKPLRGARITATLGYKSVSRFTDSTGRYQISGLKLGSYDVSATAWGYETKWNTKNLSEHADISFTLAPKWDVHRISTADLLSALPENEDTLELRATCIKCHNLSYMVRNIGLTADQWTDKILDMSPAKTYVTPKVTHEQAEKMGTILAKYFGPDSVLPTREQVHHPEMSDAALRATFTEYKVPTKSYIHTIKPSPDGKYVWFTEFDNHSKKLGRLDVATENFLEIQLPSAASTFAVAKDGDVWISAGRRLFHVDSATGGLKDVTPAAASGTSVTNESAGGEESGGRTMEADSSGNVWFAGGLRVVKFDARTGMYERFPLPKVTTVPEDYYRNILNDRSEGQKEFGYGTYALTVDSHDDIWFTAYDVGNIGRLDPATREVSMYKIPNALWIKGVTVDKNENVWFGNFLHGTLGKLDPKTGKVEQYQPPTRYASVYTPVIDKDGNLWLSDFSGSQLTRFNPTSKKFTEYPLPAADDMDRFFGVDPHGRVWYTDFSDGKIGVLDPGDSKAP